ncbi:MAG: hypothetical protein ACREFX_08080 [Opitutaceae bacterium]
MAGFAPPVVSRNPQPLDRGVLVQELADFLQQRKAPREIVDALFELQIGIKEWSVQDVKVLSGSPLGPRARFDEAAEPQG